MNRWLGLVAFVLFAGGAWAQTPEPTPGQEGPRGENNVAGQQKEFEQFSVHFQATATPQGYPAFHADYSGPNSLPRGGEVRTSYSSTFFFGARVWEGGEVYADPEMFGGKPIGQGFGIAGFPNGDLNRVSTSHPTVYLARAYFKQTFGFGGEREKIEADQNQLAKSVDVSRLTITAGKFSAADVFDNNTYSHDPRTQFMNWALFDNGAWDYPADVRGYTYGVALDLNQPQWALRYGIFMEPNVASGAHFDYAIGNAYGQALEWEQRYQLASRPGRVRVMGFLNRAHMGDYARAAELTPADITPTRRTSTKYGVGVNFEQEIADGIGLFGRLGWADGRREDWAFTEIDRTASLGVSAKGSRWGRADDTVGLAGVVNGLSGDHRRYLEAGGVGFIIGDGRLRYDVEEIIETYYAAKLAKGLTVSADAQWVNHPAYNRDRGPVAIFGVRVHYEF